MSEKSTPDLVGKSNGESPAFPTYEYCFYDGVAEIGGQHFGFTKREVIAKDLMAARLSDPSVRGSWEDIAIGAVNAADALLAELAKPQGSQNE